MNGKPEKSTGAKESETASAGPITSHNICTPNQGTVKKPEKSGRIYWLDRSVCETHHEHFWVTQAFLAWIERKGGTETLSKSEGVHALVKILDCNVNAATVLIKEPAPQGDGEYWLWQVEINSEDSRVCFLAQEEWS